MAYVAGNKKRNIFIILGVVFVVVVTVYFVKAQKAQPGPNQAPGALNVLGETGPVPTPFPFEEVTIPHLRSRSYKSALGELSQVSDNESYSSNLTSYDSDGLKINAILTKPKGQMPEGGWPAIVFVHGYIPPASYQTLTQYSAHVDALAREGFVVFKIDLRGHGSSEGEPGGAYYSGDYVIDVLNAYAAIAGVGFVNPDGIGLWGHSMAGNVVMRSFATRPDIPAVVVWAGAVYSYTDQQKYGIDDNSYQPPGQASERVRRRQRIRDLYGEPNAESFFWRQMAPTNYLGDLKGAIALNHAVDDPVVNIGYSRDLNTLLDDTSVPHELKEYPSGGHNISGAAFNQAMQNTATFFKKYL